MSTTGIYKILLNSKRTTSMNVWGSTGIFHGKVKVFLIDGTSKWGWFRLHVLLISKRALSSGERIKRGTYWRWHVSGTKRWLVLCSASTRWIYTFRRRRAGKTLGTRAPLKRLHNARCKSSPRPRCTSSASRQQLVLLRDPFVASTSPATDKAQNKGLWQIRRKREPGTVIRHIYTWSSLTM